MKLTKIKIDALYGIEHLELDGKSIELKGGTGTGKTSVLDSIKLALTNKSDRGYIVKNGEKEGQIFIQTDTGIEINRKKRTTGSDYNKVTQFNKEVPKSQTFINDIFTPLQLNPIEFSSWTEKEQNRAILDLITFDWDLDWIKEQFGELPRGVNYDQHILQVLEDIQSKKGTYWLEREECNRNELYKRQAVAEMAQKIPQGYQVEYWQNYDLATKSQQLHSQNKSNDEIRRATAFLESNNNKMRGLQADTEIKKQAQTDSINAERNSLNKTLERLKGEMAMAEQQLSQLDNVYADKIKVIEAEHQASIAKLEADMGTARLYADKEIVDTSELQAEINNAINMKEFVSEFKTMSAMEIDRQQLKERSEYLTGQIEKARSLPGEVLENCELPIDGLEVKDGVPLINGLPISNLSDGEKIELCVDITLAQNHNLEMILLNGVESLDENNRNKLYAKCKDKGLQIIAARTTDDDCLTIVNLED